ncbi:protein S40-4-like [Bidens hawaiensis]|uniref:protein S40-4-like n=1 Tax=Bidens hawaiensis TaxID=980011 RepID=UPI00404B922B
MLRSTHRYISGNHRHSPATTTTESDIWNVPTSPDFQTPIPISKPSKPTKLAGETPSSLPVNVPDWSKILKQDCGLRNPRWTSEFDENEFDSGVDSGASGRTPPHEVVARKLARTRVVSFSVHEGVGRTLKGRDLSRVRNAVWEKIGFQVNMC